MTNTHNKIALFEKKQIRKIWYDDEWFFSVVDVVSALTDSTDPKDYWYRIKKRASNEEEIELSTICRQLKLLAPDGKMRETDCANTEGILRIIQSIPLPKTEPFKRWLAKVGYERMKNGQNILFTKLLFSDNIAIEL
jgi:prophage antirepressor-like protein